MTPQPSTAAATGSDDASKPGNGHGDENHEHSGPPGQDKEKHKDKKP